MNDNVTDWVANKISEGSDLKVLDRTPENFLTVVAVGKSHSFPVAVIGVKGVINPVHIEPLFSGLTKPEFVVNIPSKTLWSGAAISIIHSAPAAFGSLGELIKAAHMEAPSEYRNKEWGFFQNAISQHSNVSRVARLYDAVFEAHLYDGECRIIALVDAYNMSAEDVRNALDRFGKFDVALKMSSYGSITNAAVDAAASIGAEALMLKDLMKYLAK